MEDENELDELEKILDDLDRGDAAGALRRLARPLREAGDADPVVNFLAGRALLALDRVSDAVLHLRRATELDPDDPDYRSELALALYVSCRFDESWDHVGRVLATDPDRAADLEIQARLLERRGDLDAAESRYRRAFEIYPEQFPLPVRLASGPFRLAVEEAAARLPDEFRAHLDEVAVTIEDVPSEEILLDGDPPLDPDLLGLFVGTPLPDRSHLGPGGELPSRILLFQRNLERIAPDEETLRQEITITLYHELGHYLGLDEEELSEIDLG